MSLTKCLFAYAHPEHTDDHVLSSRVSAEFREMPGLRITLAQASRLFSMDPGPCERVLHRLVDIGELSTDGRMFTRADTGRRYA
ncbi:MAG TPA: hypothetical protein VGF24_11950 [Vicinamibacterales bacterium]